MWFTTPTAQPSGGDEVDVGKAVAPSAGGQWKCRPETRPSVSTAAENGSRVWAWVWVHTAHTEIHTHTYTSIHMHTHHYRMWLNIEQPRDKTVKKLMWHFANSKTLRLTLRSLFSHVTLGSQWPCNTDHFLCQFKVCFLLREIPLGLMEGNA